MNMLKIHLPLFLILGFAALTYSIPAYPYGEVETADSKCKRGYKELTEKPTVETLYKIYGISPLDGPEDDLGHLEFRFNELTKWAEKFYDDNIDRCSTDFPDLAAPGENVKAAFMQDLEKHIENTKTKVEELTKMGEVETADSKCKRGYKELTEKPTVETLYNLYGMSPMDGPEDDLGHLELRFHELTKWAEKFYDNNIDRCSTDFPDLAAPGENVKAAFMQDLEKHIGNTKAKIAELTRMGEVETADSECKRGYKELTEKPTVETLYKIYGMSPLDGPEDDLGHLEFRFNELTKWAEIFYDDNIHRCSTDFPDLAAPGENVKAAFVQDLEKHIGYTKAKIEELTGMGEVETADSECKRGYKELTEKPTVETLYKIYGMSPLDGPEDDLGHLEFRFNELTKWAEIFYDDNIDRCSTDFPDLAAPGENVKAAFIQDLEKHIETTKKKIEKLKQMGAIEAED